GSDLDVVDRRADRNRLQGKRIADFRRSGRTAGNFLTDRDADRRDDVTLLTIGVVQQRETRGAHRIVFDRRDGGFDAVLVALEIHEADFLLVTAADAARGDATIMVAATGFLADDDQRLLRRRLSNVAKVRDRDVSRGRR